MLCGLLGSLLMLTAMLALSDDPPPVGVKVTAIVQVELAGRALQVPPVTAKSGVRAAEALAHGQREARQVGDRHVLGLSWYLRCQRAVRERRGRDGRRDRRAGAERDGVGAQRIGTVGD